MARPSSDPDWLEALRRSASGLEEADRRRARRFTPTACSRCQRPAANLESWLERRRLRTPDPTPAGGIRYVHEVRAHLVCGPCYLEVRRGKPAVKSHALQIMAVALAGAALLAAALPAAMPDLLAAFWRNGAAPYGWHEGHREGRPAFVQGRY